MAGFAAPSAPGGPLIRVHRLAALAVLAYLLSGAVAMGFADGLIFLPPGPSYDDQVEGLIRIPTEAGDTIAAHLVEAADPLATVLFAHGNAEDLGHGRWHTERYRELGVSVLSFDYPGYGLSTGRPSEEGAYAAADAAYRFLTVARGADPATVIAHGRSLGGGVAVDLASRYPVGGLVIESSFVSAYRVMTRVPLLPFDQFESLRKLDAVRAPVLVIHGGRDRVVAEWHGRRLHDAVPEGRRQALWVPDAGHNDLVAVAGERYWRALDSFIERVARAP